MKKQLMKTNKRTRIKGTPHIFVDITKVREHILNIYNNNSNNKFINVR